jgi:hypothetical protein
MVTFKDTAQMMEFQLPAGWERAPVDPVIEKKTLEIRQFRTSVVGFRKGDRGTLAVWCDKWDKNRPQLSHMIDVLNAYAPMHKRGIIGFEVDSPDTGFISRPNVNAFPATQAVKGERHEFLIVTVNKRHGTTVLEGCDYMLFGRSTTNEFSDEILKDITEIAATLKHPKVDWTGKPIQ